MQDFRPTYLPVGAGLARDAGTSFYLEEQSAAIAGKPAPITEPEGAGEPWRIGRMVGRGPFGSFWVLSKWTRRKGETNISVIRKCRICTRRNS